MLEMLITLRRAQGEGAIGGANRHTGMVKGRLAASKIAGDVVCVKKSPAVWGAMEKKNMLITYLDDPDLEAEVDRRGGLIVLPFQESRGDTMVKRCRV